MCEMFQPAPDLGALTASTAFGVEHRGVGPARFVS